MCVIVYTSAFLFLKGDGIVEKALHGGINIDTCDFVYGVQVHRCASKVAVFDQDDHGVFKRQNADQ